MTRYRYVSRPPAAPPRYGPWCPTIKAAIDTAVDDGLAERDEQGQHWWKVPWAEVESGE